MGQCIITRKNGGGNALKSLGFVNVPSGNWIFKTGAKDITAKDDSIIPIAVKMAVGSVSGTATFGSSFTLSNTAKINGYAVGNISNSFTNGYGTANHSGSARTTIGFVPICYGMDLTATQNGYTSGTLACWLEKK